MQAGHVDGGKVSKAAAFMKGFGPFIAAFGSGLGVAWLGGEEYRRIAFNEKAQEERQKAHEMKTELSAQLARAESQAELAKSQAALEKTKTDILQHQLNLGFHGSPGSWRQVIDAGNKDS
jgi:hypothetical protein